jgi:hypothetical protein
MGLEPLCAVLGSLPHDVSEPPPRSHCSLESAIPACEYQQYPQLRQEYPRSKPQNGPKQPLETQAFRVRPPDGALGCSTSGAAVFRAASSTSRTEWFLSVTTFRTVDPVPCQRWSWPAVACHRAHAGHVHHRREEPPLAVESSNYGPTSSTRR